jgi:predicted small secreted protein
MKRTSWTVAALAVVALGLAGCHKQNEMPTSQTVDGVSVDMPKLQQALSGNTNQETRRLIVEASMGLRYGDYVKSMMALEQLSNIPDLTPEQKKVVADVIEQEKKLAGAAPPAAAPAQ